MKTAVISASLGEFDGDATFTDENFPPRKAIAPRLQAKIPKFFGWQLKPDYDYYIWHDGNIKLTKEDEEYLIEQCQGYDMVVYKHHTRPNIRQEARYIRKGLREQSTYLVERYSGEWTQEIYDLIEKEDYDDNLLFMGGVFAYINSPAVQSAMKEWWYFTTRYSVFDQLAFPYVTRFLKRNILDNWSYTLKRHNLRK